MSKFFIFAMLWWLIGNPIIAFLVLLLLIYIADQRFVGIFPSLTKPIRRNRLLKKAKYQLLLNPNDLSAKHECARLLIEKKKYSEAQKLLKEIVPKMEHSAEIWFELGLASIRLGQLEEGESYLLKAVELDERVKYGQPFIVLGHAFLKTDRQKAFQYLERFQQIHSSSCEGYYVLGRIYGQSGKKAEAQQAFHDAIQIYKSLPKYMKRRERKWVLRSLAQKWFS
ncbi:tetratricopeptide repeat protein [Marinicrinis lubricantis]|uniref:Tetratricopeptide repeat protein n=1 Tax=Marinicrinis lubricantis TaxID=2086470 RepID=A0ABW1IP45_9BACL